MSRGTSLTRNGEYVKLPWTEFDCYCLMNAVKDEEELQISIHPETQLNHMIEMGAKEDRYYPLPEKQRALCKAKIASGEPTGIDFFWMLPNTLTPYIFQAEHHYTIEEGDIFSDCRGSKKLYHLDIYPGDEWSAWG